MWQLRITQLVLIMELDSSDRLQAVQPIIDKLKNMYGIPNCLLKWIGSYLKHRQQRVRANQTTSSWKQLKGAMPQGSWIGPLSFLALINDLTTGYTSTWMIPPCPRFYNPTPISPT